jgi:phosphoglycerol transferase MdoB-like AlkP superfamily enzyme
MTKREIINKAFNGVGFVILIGILLLGKTLLFYYNTIAINEQLELQTVLGTLSFITVIVCFLSVLPNRARIITSIIVDFLISILLFGDQIYYTYSNSVLSVAQITNLQYGEEIISTLPMVVQINQILYFLDIFILIILLLIRILKIEKKSKSTKKQWIAKAVVGIIGAAIFCIIGVDYVEKASQKSYNKDLQIRETTIFGYHVYDIVNALTMKQQTKYKNYDDMIQDYNQLKEDYETKYGQEMYPLEGILEGKNVIILQLESVQEFVINKEINGKQITPNLNKFLSENIEFTNMNMQSYSTTADSEHTTITSLYPMENGMAFSKYYTNTYDDIFKIFNNANYFTSYMHGNYPYFWNRGNVYGRLNLNELVLKEQFEDLSENINGDLSDELLYRQAVQKLKEYDQPFVSYIVSASSHTPFILEGLQDRSKVSIDVGKYKDTYFGYYLEAVNYADYAFGVFIQELKDAGIYDDTAILVFGDHNGLTMYNDELIDFLSYTDSDITEVDLKLNYTKVACGFKIPGIEHIEIEKPVSKLDIKPTLAYLCNLEDTFSLGTNMFANKDFVCLNNERIITSRYYYDAGWYDIKTGEMLKWEELDEDTKKLLDEYYQDMKTELDISNSVSINNLLK